MKNIIVMDESGTQIGLTYPKRAKGLVKHGRAVRVGESAIRLTGSCPSFTMEDKQMATAIYFDPENFHALQDAKEALFSREFMSGLLSHELKGVLTLGDSFFHWSEAISEPMELKADTDYVITFWVRMNQRPADKDVNDFRILFTDDAEKEYDRQEEYIYRLGDNSIQPAKTYNGWELYEIPFRTKATYYTYLKFVAMHNTMTIMPAGDAADYAALEDQPVEYVEASQASDTMEDARSAMLLELTEQMKHLDYSMPWCVDVMKEMKDMIERILRQ